MYSKLIFACKLKIIIITENMNCNCKITAKNLL